eukprot:c30751_g1_i1 orf=281-505(+)
MLYRIIHDSFQPLDFKLHINRYRTAGCCHHGRIAAFESLYLRSYKNTEARVSFTLNRQINDLSSLRLWEIKKRG